MANKKVNNQPVSQSAQTDPPRKRRSKLLIILLIFFLLILGCAGFAAGVYFKYIDITQLAQQYKLYDYPVIGGFFPRPLTNFEPVDLPPDNMTEQLPLQVPPIVAPNNAQPPQPAVALTDAEKEKLLKEAKKAEAKRISKLARLYGGMKPDEAVSIMNQLDDDTVLAILSKMEEEQVSKIMALFDPGRSARLSQDILRGKIQ